MCRLLQVKTTTTMENAILSSLFTTIMLGLKISTSHHLDRPTSVRIICGKQFAKQLRMSQSPSGSLEGVAMLCTDGSVLVSLCSKTAILTRPRRPIKSLKKPVESCPISPLLPGPSGLNHTASIAAKEHSG